MVRIAFATVAAFFLSSPSVSIAAVLYDNGSVVDVNGLSILEPPASTLGFGAQTSIPNRVADNFTVGVGGWSVSSIDFFSYQTSASGFTFTSATWSIVAGNDVNSGSIVASGTSAVTDGGLMGYRVTSSTLGNTQRAIYRINTDINDLALAPGNYFLTWSLDGSGASGPWVPPVPGSLGSGNALQALPGGAFATIIDAGAGQSVELPFTINGMLAGVPEPSTWGLLILGFGFVGGALRSAKRRQDLTTSFT